MKPRTLAFPASMLAALLCAAVAASPAAAEQRFIVRTDPALDGTQTITSVCSAVGCTVRYPIDGRLGKVFLVTTPDTTDPVAFVALITSLGGIQDAQVDGVVRTRGAEAGSVPPALLDAEPVTYFGATVRRGYVQQPANTIVGISSAYNRYKMTGAGVTVAVIDTGVDPRHPALAGVLLPGYDFTRDVEGGSELRDLGPCRLAVIDQSTVAVLDQSTIAVLDQSTIAVLDQSTVAVLDQSTVATLDSCTTAVVDQSTVAVLDQSTIAVLDQSTIAVLDTPEYAAFGHGTMVAGIVHLTAPGARIMPLKAFRPDGTAYASDVIRAIYYAVDNNAKVINMSFEFATRSRELENSIVYAYSKKVIMAASTGNDGQQIVVYPAGRAQVIGVASTTDFDSVSAFSNFGPKVAFIGAPGEGIVTTYPFGAYAAAWGTSFSTPFAAGAGALLAERDNSVPAGKATSLIGRTAVWISSAIKKGRLDILGALNELIPVPASAGDIQCSSFSGGVVPPGDHYYNIIVDTNCTISSDATVYGNVIELDSTEWTIHVGERANITGRIEEKGRGGIRR